MVKYANFFLMDYDWFNAKRVVDKEHFWGNYSIAVFYSDTLNDVLGKVTILEKKPLFVDYPITALDLCSNLVPHCALCTLQKHNNKWEYFPLWKGVSDIEKELQRFYK